MFKINIITQLVVFFTFSVALNVMSVQQLMIAFALLMLILSKLKNHPFFRLTKRLKWFYIVMLLIFAFNTPGQHVAEWPFVFAPTYEGLHAGFAQLLRILVMLAALSTLLGLHTKQTLISGFYFLLSPLKYCGIETERFAARLWLTLHYVELQQQAPKKAPILSSLGQSLADIFTQTQHDEVQITLEKPVFTLFDYCVIVVTIMLLSWWIFKVNT